MDPEYFTETKSLTEKEFDEQFTLVTNEVEGGACNGEQRFETFGPDMDFVREQPAEKVWTCVESDDEICYFAGVHFVNRLYYIVTEESWSE